MLPTLLAWMLFDVSPQARCDRTEEENAASIIYGQAERMRDTAQTAQEHAEAAERYASALDVLPPTLLHRGLGSKIVAKAHLEAQRAYTDPSASVEARWAWRDADVERLTAYLNAFEVAQSNDDPCLGDGTFAMDALEQAKSVQLVERVDDPPDAGVSPPPEPPQARPATPTPEPTPRERDTPSSNAASGQGLVIAGSTLLVSGAALLVAGPAQHAWRRGRVDESNYDEPDEREALDDYLNQGKTIQTALLVSGGVVAATGLTLLSVGLARRAKRTATRVSATPQLSPTRVGATLAWRF